tara:strand:- start:2011 stop:3006 length:996 start_codon:yes stop_codon:yes gene_type:complete
LLNQKIKIGIIGGGHIVKTAHLPSYVENSDVEISGITDFDANVEEKLNLRKLGIQFIASTEELLKRKDIELVVVATPTDSHFEICSSALELGKHVLCQKPLGGKIAPAIKLINLAEEKGLILTVNDSFRWYPTFKKVKKIISDGQIGDPFFTLFEDCGWSDFRAHEQLGDRFLLLRNSSHKLDLFRYWFGDNIKSIESKIEHVKHHNVKGETLTTVSLKYADNHLVQLIDNGASSAPGYRRIVIHGTKGAVRVDDKSVELFNKKHGIRSKWKRVQVEGSIIPHAFNEVLGTLIEKIKSGKEVYYDAKDYINTLKLIENAYLSAQKKKTIDL